jgi:hypothetical protein
MKGDFSKWQFDPKNNYSGVLHQQGRVLLDSDWNAQTRIINEWQDKSGQDTIGPDVAAVPASEPDSFKVQRALLRTFPDRSRKIELTLTPGRLWADGLLVYLDGETDVVRIATYLQPPIQDIPRGGFGIDDDIRDAVILEVWREAINGFQLPESLIEPALGGPDTTERVHTAMAFRLLRIGRGDTCKSIKDRLKDNFSQKGKLTVSLNPPGKINEECPKVEGGGYTGFEHHLYRIEIAKVNDQVLNNNGPMFKWSQFNGGLVGRGIFDANNKKVQITANEQSVIMSGLKKFYLEAVEYNKELGHWEVTYGTEVTLNSDNELDLSDPPIFGSIPASDESVFFRLWNDIRKIREFPKRSPVSNPKELRDGIRLEFEPTFGVPYVAGDFWTFPVRAGKIVNKEILIGKEDASGTIIGESPEGIHYHRVPLGILNWNGQGDISADPDKEEIDDCRDVFPPLTDLNPGCCIGVKPEENLKQVVKEVIAAGGGCICLLPGDHRLTESLDLAGASNIRFVGFGLASRLHISEKFIKTFPFFIKDVDNISFNSFAVINKSGRPVWSCQNVSSLNISNMFVYSSFLKGNEPVIDILDSESHGWHFENNFFLARMGMGGLMLADSTIRGNLWLGSISGISLGNIFDVRIEGNRFFGMSGSRIEKLDAQIDSAISDPATVSKTLPKLLDAIVVSVAKNVISRYIGLDASSLLDVEFKENQIIGGIGLSAELVENCTVHSNQFYTRLYGADCGLTHGLRFSQNHVGAESSRVGTEVGLRMAADAIDCKILDNSFVNVSEGIVFESDLGGNKEISRDFYTNLRGRDNLSDEELKEVLEGTKRRKNERFERRVILIGSYLRLRKTERTLIQGNLFHCEQFGIEWSGSANIIDFRISSNSFVGCQDVAIQIEPEGLIPLIKHVDTSVRLIEKNRFEVYAGAIRATIGSVRVEKNDIRVDAPKISGLAWDYMLPAIGKYVFQSANFLKAVSDNDVSGMRLTALAAVHPVKENPSFIKSEPLSKEIGEKIPASYKFGAGDVNTDKAFVIKTLAAMNDRPLIADFVIRNISRAQNFKEGFAINLSGLQNRVIHNRVYSKNQQIRGGIVFHMLSGEVRDNEVEVSRIALLITGKASKLNLDTRIFGNSLKAVGTPSRGGRETPNYALAITSLNPGHLSIIANYFEGSVMVGADPISLLGLHRATKIDATKVLIHNNALKYDYSAYSKAIFSIYKPPNYAGMVPVDPKIIWPVLKINRVFLPDFLTDPNRNRSIVYFTNNRVVHGWSAIAQTVASHCPNGGQWILGSG